MVHKKKSEIRLWAVAVWLLVWQAGSMALGQELFLPSPLSVLLRLGELALSLPFWQAIARSAVRIFGGFLLSCAGGVIAAAAAARWRKVRELLAPVVAVMKAVPVVSFIILALVWLDSEELPLLIACLMVFPPVYLNVLEGIAATDRELLEMARVFRVSGARKLWGIYCPQVLPYFHSAVSLALGLCWKAGIAAEVIGLPSGTLGERLYMAKVYYATPDLFAWTMVILLVSGILERGFLCLLDIALRKVGAGGTAD